METSPVWCFTKFNDTVYAGTGPYGKVIKSTNLRLWSDFEAVDDCHIRALTVWANALFIGTQPKGKIYVHNFTSEESYLFVETEDNAVIAFAEFQGKLYAGTSPIGIVYSFDGTSWKDEHKPYGLGVTAMVATDLQLLVFSKGAEGPVAFNGAVWETSPSSRIQGQGQTVASFRAIKNDIYQESGLDRVDPNSVISGNDARLASPISPQFNLSTATIYSANIIGSTVIAGGMDDGMLISITEAGITKVGDIGMPINKIVNLGGNGLMIASGGTVLLGTQVVIEPFVPPQEDSSVSSLSSGE